jgi:hypothetical protein
MSRSSTLVLSLALALGALTGASLQASPDDPGAPSAPALSSLSPTLMSTLDDHTLTITGSGFANAGDTSVVVGNQPIRPHDIDVVDDTTIIAKVNTPIALGPQPVVVGNDNGASNALSLTFQQNDPPAFGFPAVTSFGELAAWEYGGDPGDDAILLFAADLVTEEFEGQELLTADLVIPLGPVNAAGYGVIIFEVAEDVPPGTFYSQILFVDPGSKTLDGAELTAIGCTLFENAGD